MASAVTLQELPYRPDSCALFETLRDLPGAAMLDSADNTGRFDILTASPLPLPLPDLPRGCSETQARQYFDELKVFHADFFGATSAVTQEIPFCGGILGYLDYDAGTGLNKLPPHPGEIDSTGQSAHLGAFQWAVIQDHLLEKSVLATLPGVDPAQRRDIQLRLAGVQRGTTGEFALQSRFASCFSPQQYRNAHNRIQAYIHSGDCYQVNLAQRFSAPYSGDPWYAYKILRKVAGAPFSAFITDAEGNTILSLSPERFAQVHGRHVAVSPIKGTRPRHADRRRDREAARQLLTSEKDRAENLMIVDLLRNDLGRSCTPGSIHVERLFELQSFPTVHHLVSTISGELAPGNNAWDVLRDSFPGGSITGAPKRRAMEIIAELEPHPRRAYCGTVFYVSADGRMDSNIAIRTLQCHGGEISCWGGGGIVADSRWEREYEETYHKIGRFLEVLDNFDSCPTR